VINLQATGKTVNTQVKSRKARSTTGGEDPMAEDDGSSHSASSKDNDDGSEFEPTEDELDVYAGDPITLRDQLHQEVCNFEPIFNLVI